MVWLGDQIRDYALLARRTSYRPRRVTISNRYLRPALVALTLSALTLPAFVAGQASPTSQAPPIPHRVNTTKFTIVDLAGTKPFYEKLLGMKELDRFVARDFLIEPFMGFDQGGRIGLLAFSENENLAKTPFPVSVVFVPDLDKVAARFEATQHPIQMFSGDTTGGARLALATDPSGNTIEVVERAGLPAVGGARLIVDDRAKAEAFFVRVFDVEPEQRIVTDTFDEVFMNFGEGMFVALFEPKTPSSFPRSEQPVVSIYTTDFDAVLDRVNVGGLRVRKFGEAMFLANDPSGNVVEVVRQAAR